jgi:hypothetical protein
MQWKVKHTDICRRMERSSIHLEVCWWRLVDTEDSFSPAERKGFYRHTICQSKYHRWKDIEENA